MILGFRVMRRFVVGVGLFGVWAGEFEMSFYHSLFRSQAETCQHQTVWFLVGNGGMDP